MNTTFQAVNFDADARLAEFVREKTARLGRLFDKIIETQVILKDERTHAAPHKSIDLRVIVPQQTLVVSETASTFEEATDKAIDQMTRRIKKYKETTLART